MTSQRAHGSAESIILHRVAELNGRGHTPSVWEAVCGTRWPATGRLSARGRSYRYTVVQRLLETGELEDVAQSGATSKALRVPARARELERIALERAHAVTRAELERIAAQLAELAS